MAGGYAYVISIEGMDVVDVSNPTQPAEVGFHTNTYYCLQAFSGLDIGRARCDIYVTDGPSPGAVLRSSKDAGQRYAYVAGGEMGLEIVDVSDPTRPVRVSDYLHFASLDGITATGEYIYLAAGHLGLLILRATLPGIATSTSTFTPIPSVTPTGTATSTPTVTSTPSSTSTLMLSVTPAATAKPTPTFTPTLDDLLPPRIYLPYVGVNSVYPYFLIPSITPTVNTATLTPGALPRVTHTVTVTPTATSTATPTVSPTLQPSVTPLPDLVAHAWQFIRGYTGDCATQDALSQR